MLVQLHFDTISSTVPHWPGYAINVLPDSFNIADMLAMGMVESVSDHY